MPKGLIVCGVRARARHRPLSRRRSAPPARQCRPEHRPGRRRPANQPWCPPRRRYRRLSRRLSSLQRCPPPSRSRPAHPQSCAGPASSRVKRPACRRGRLVGVTVTAWIETPGCGTPVGNPSHPSRQIRAFGGAILTLAGKRATISAAPSAPRITVALGEGVRSCGPGEGPGLSRSGNIIHFGSIRRRFNDTTGVIGPQ